MESIGATYATKTPHGYKKSCVSYNVSGVRSWQKMSTVRHGKEYF